MGWSAAVIMPVLLVGGLAVLAHLPDRYPVGLAVHETLDRVEPRSVTVAVTPPAAKLPKPAPPAVIAAAPAPTAVPSLPLQPSQPSPEGYRSCERFLAMNDNRRITGLQCIDQAGRRVVVGLVNY